MKISSAHLGYPLFLFIGILLAKVGYIGVESFYNYHILISTTSPELSRQTAESLNLNGHRISSVGITLLLMPLFYFLLKRLSSKLMYSLLAVLSLGSYVLSYNLLNQAVDYIVETNKDKRHEAYYINVFKYGVLNDIFTYDSFISAQRVRSNTLTVNDRILLTNTFLLLYADENLVKKLKDRGKNKVADEYTDRSKEGDYKRKYFLYQEATKDISFLWKNFKAQRNKLSNKISSITLETTIINAHKTLVNGLRTSYKDYKQAWSQADKRIKAETSPKKLKTIEIDLNRFFRYQNTKKAQDKYGRTMHKKFGHYIQPHEWLNSKKRLTRTKIKYVIKNDIENQVRSKTNGLNRGLSEKDFSNHIDTKISVSKNLKAQGILIPVSFDYSYTQFKKAYLLGINKTINSGTTDFYKKLEKQIGKNDLKLDFS